jgi:hypothetical protein
VSRQFAYVLYHHLDMGLFVGFEIEPLVLNISSIVGIRLHRIDKNPRSLIVGVGHQYIGNLAACRGGSLGDEAGVVRLRFVV